MKIRWAIYSFFAITLLYLAALIWVDSQREFFSGVAHLWPTLSLIFLVSLMSYLIRYIRWYWLLVRAGYRTSFLFGFLAYLSGFAFTATPGKVGELIRIRYFGLLNVPPWKVLAAFVYERAFDLIIVLMLSSLLISQVDFFPLVALFVFLFLVVIIFMIRNPMLFKHLSVYCRYKGFKRLSHVIRILRDGLAGCWAWANSLDAFVSGMLGFVAWGLTSLCFVYLLAQIDINLPLNTSIAIYPLAMLAGAASMFLGGLGTTEATIITIISLYGFDLARATLAAVGIRLATIWFSIVCGLIAIAILELSEQSENTMDTD